jgi:hypothetical protein
MRIPITFEVDDHLRRAIAARYGQTGLASYADCRTTINSLANAVMELIQAEYERSTTEGAIAHA